MLKVLRTEIPIILGFEEVGIMCKPNEGSESYVALSPNLSKEVLNEIRQLDLFYLNPLSGFTVECIRTGIIASVKSPRNYDKFMESSDCLCPLVFLKEIVLVPLKTTSGNTIGCLQLINKVYGKVSSIDIDLATKLAPIIANSLHMVITGVIMSLTMDQMAASAKELTNCVEQVYKFK